MTRHSKLGGRRRVHEIPVLVRKIFPCLHGIFSKSRLMIIWFCGIKSFTKCAKAIRITHWCSIRNRLKVVPYFEENIRDFTKHNATATITVNIHTEIWKYCATNFQVYFLLQNWSCSCCITQHFFRGLLSPRKCNLFLFSIAQLFSRCLFIPGKFDWLLL